MKIKKFSLSGVLSLALGCAVLLPGTSASARSFLAMGGTTFALNPIPNTSPQQYTHSVDGVVWVSVLGDCTIHWDVVATMPPANSTTWTGSGTFTITTADGDQLNASVVGVFPESPAWGANGYGVLDIHYSIKFTGGTGIFAKAHGTATISHGFASLAMPATLGSPSITLPGYGLLDLTPGGIPGLYPPNADLIDPGTDTAQGSPSGVLTGKACWLMRGNLLGVRLGKSQNHQ